MLSYQSLMPAGAGTPRYENAAWSLEVFGCGWCRPSPLDSRFRENDEVGWWPAGVGLPRPAQGAHEGHPYGDVGGWWDTGGNYGARRQAHGWGQAPALHFSVGLQEDGRDPAGCFGEVLDFVRLEGPAEDGALAVGEPLLEDLVAA